MVRQQKSKDAEQMLGHLSDLLRRVLEDVDAQEFLYAANWSIATLPGY